MKKENLELNGKVNLLILDNVLSETYSHAHAVTSFTIHIIHALVI